MDVLLNGFHSISATQITPLIITKKTVCFRGDCIFPYLNLMFHKINQQKPLLLPVYSSNDLFVVSKEENDQDTTQRIKFKQNIDHLKPENIIIDRRNISTVVFSSIIGFWHLN
jgi:hypothetical protein